MTLLFSKADLHVSALTRPSVVVVHVTSRHRLQRALLDERALRQQASEVLGLVAEFATGKSFAVALSFADLSG